MKIFLDNPAFPYKKYIFFHRTFREKTTMHRALSQIYTAVFLTGIFCYLWMRIDVSLCFVAHEPFFSLSAAATKEQLSYPGGMTGYFADFVKQFFTNPLAGAAIITLLLCCLSAASFALIRAAYGKAPIVTLHLYPAAFFAALHSNYYQSLSITIDVTVATALAALQCRTKGRTLPVRLVRFLIYSCVLYFISGGGALLIFSLFTILIAIFTERKFIFAFFCAASAALIPLVSEEFIFLISLKDAYLYSIPLNFVHYKQPFVIAAAYFSLPLMLIVFPLLRGMNFLRASALHVVSPILLLAVTAFAFLASFNRNDHISLTFCRNTREGRWQEILEDFRKTWFNNRITNHAANEALFYAGLLPTDLFSFPQSFGDRGLFLFENDNDYSPRGDPFFYMYRCELFLKLGLVNEAQRWGYEALSANGETAWALKRIIQSHALRNETMAALSCLSILETSPLHRSWARQFHHRLINNTFFVSDPLIAMISQSMPTTDFICSSDWQPCIDIEDLLRQHPVNRMAFEYCMASYLLQGNLPKVASVLSLFDSFGYPAVPRLYEEALAMLKHIPGMQLPGVAGRVSRQTLDDYARFENILEKYHGNFKEAEREIAPDFWNTYWYYYLYTLPAMGREP
jgi:hypothetical protein